MRRKFMAWIMSIMMIATMVPTMAFAEGEAAEKSPYEVTDHGGGGLDGGLYMSKTLDKIDKDGKGTITLETYVKGKIETSSTPMDIVLVLDVSGSMDDPISRTDRTKKIDALKSSVNSFIDSVSADASKNDVDHKISIVKFAGDKTDKVGNDTYSEWGYRYNYSQIVQNLTDVRNSGAEGLKTKVKSLSAAGATAADYGMQLANTEISKSTSADRNRVVIMFTDGEPNHQNGFDGDVADAAISASKGMKDKGVSVYTIGMFDGADNSDVTYRTSNVNKYMHYVSSNYPNARSMNNSGERAAGSSFYKTAKTASELEAIFEEISSETKDTELDESTIIRDVMSEYFETDGSAADIKIYEAEYKGNDKFGEKIQITGDALSKYTVTADKGQVSVNGFDFEAVMDTPSVKGKKLIIEIPVKLKDSTISNESLSGKTIPSNNTDSAKSSIIKTTEPAQSWNFEIPKVKLPVAKTDISGTKTWVDDSNADNTRPDSITLKLYRNIKGGDKTEVTGVTPTWTKNGNTWTYEYKDLPKTDADGNVYTYTVKEELTATSPYEAKYDGNNITNSLKSGTTDFSGEKVWKDSDGKPIDNSKLPASIEIELLQNGESMTPVQKQTVTPGADNKWTYTFTGLPKYDKDGKRYQYSIKELSVNGYQSSVTTAGEMTNQYNGGESVTVEGTKTWTGVPDGAKVPEVTIKLLQNGKEYKTTKVKKNADGTYSYEFKDLPTYDESGNKYTYTVEEVTPAGYESTKKGNDFENKYTGGREISVSGTKTWLNMPSGLDKKDYPDVTIILSQNGTEYDRTTLTEGREDYEFKGLPEYNTDGKKFEYTVSEVVPDGYVSTQNGNDFTNTYTPGTVSINGVKNWVNTGDSNKFPEVTVDLYQNGTKIGSTVIKDGATSYSFDGLDKLDPKGKPYVYTVKENVPNGYTVKQGEGDKKYELTNTYTGGDTTYPVEKKWAGVDNNDPLPAKVKVTLYRDGEKTEETAELTKDNNWKHTFTGLLKYRTDGTEYKYSVKEEKVDGYTTTIDEGTVTNTYTGGDTTYPVEKKWSGVDNNDPLPASVKVTLYKDGKATDQTVELTKDNNWKHTFTGLTKYRTDGTEYDYSVKEENINGYTPEYGDNTVTNTYTGDDTEYPVEKKWSGVDNNDPLPAKVKVTLYRDGEKTEETAELTNGNDWTHVFKDLKKYRTDGSEYEYSVREEKIDGYTTEYGGNTVINSYTGGDKVSVKGTKTWIDPEGTTHPTITIELYREADGIDKTFVKSIELADGTTDYEFTDLEKYATNGSEYNYTVKEKTVDGYTTSYDKEKPNNITNTIKQEKIDVKGTKTWIDADGTERPDVSVQLYRDGEKFGDPVKIGSDNKYEFKDLDKYDLTDGHIYKYTVRELGADGYITTIDGYDITNSKPIKTVKGANDKSEIKVGQELTYTISWTNASKEAVTATIKDTLTKGQEYVSGDEGAVVETKDGITTVKWENVAVAAGSKVEKTFTVKVTKDAEETVANTASIKVGDKPEISSNTTGVTPKIDISGEKIWKDKDDNFKLRPDSVKITLLANGEKTDKTTEATEASGWKYSFSDLPLYNDGKKIEYTVEETPVDNYLEPEYEVVNKDGNANKINITNSIDEELFSWTGDITVDKAVAVKVDNEYAPQKVTDTFYFALFSDKELTKRATMKSEDGTETEIGIEKLELKNEASGTVTFKDIPTGTIKEPVKYYLAETDKDGVPVGEGFRYTPEFGQSGSEVSLTVKDHDADLKVANVFDNKIDVSGKKTWVDDNDKYKQRPDDITVFLKQNGEDYKDAQENTYAVHASKDTDWAYTFKDLPEFDENGDRYEYSVDEAFVEYYDAVLDGMDITNTFNKKKYYDDNPATITVTKETLLKGKEYEVNDIYYAGVFVDKDHTTLLADKEGAYIIPLVLENESSASFEFKVPYHEDGTATYYITEVTKDGTPVDKVSGLKYKASVKGGKVTVSAEDSVASVTFTNSYEQPKVPKTGDSGLPLIWMLIGLMAAALAAAAWIIFGRRETRRL